MWLGLALIVWLWGLLLYLVAYYAAVLTWTAEELHDLLGQDFYNGHIPSGGWKATIVPTLVFLAVLALVGAAQRLLASVSEALERRARVPRRVGLVASHVALIVLAVPAVHVGVTRANDGITDAIARAEREEAQRIRAEESARAFARDPFCTGEGMAAVVTSYRGGSGGMAGGEHILLDSAGAYRRSWQGCVIGAGSRIEGRYEQHGDVLVLDAPSGDVPGDTEFPIRLRDIRWGGRRYLVRETQLQSFCQAINEGREAQLEEGSFFLLRDGDEKFEVTGLPLMPEPWNDFLLKAPLEGHVTATADDSSSWIDLGAEQGVRVGMKLFVSDVPVRPEHQHLYGTQKTYQLEVDVLDVEAQRSRVRLRGYLTSSRMLMPLPVGVSVKSLRPPRL